MKQPAQVGEVEHLLPQMQQTVIMDLFWTCSSNERGSRAHNQDGAKALYLIPICASTVSYPPTLDLHLASVGISYRNVRRSCTCTSARFHSQTHGLYSEAPVSSLPSAHSFNQPSRVVCTSLAFPLASVRAATPPILPHHHSLRATKLWCTYSRNQRDYRPRIQPGGQLVLA